MMVATTVLDDRPNTASPKGTWLHQLGMIVEIQLPTATPHWWRVTDPRGVWHHRQPRANSLTLTLTR